MELLLLSNSTNYGGTMFSHAAEAFADVAAGDVVTFVPYALADWDDYADRATAALGALGIDVVSAHRSSAPDQAILDGRRADDGRRQHLPPARLPLRPRRDRRLGRRVREGETRYVGASAGTNVACPTIRTTNDMPICRPPSFAALGLVPFQINLHYIDADPASTFMGETREERIDEFLEENDCAVLALYEGSWLRVSGETAEVTGRARLFRREGRRRFSDGLDVSGLLHLTPTFDGGRRPAPGGHRHDVLAGAPLNGRTRRDDPAASDPHPGAPCLLLRHSASDSAASRRPGRTAVVYCEAIFGACDGKTANGLVRHSEKYEILVGDRQREGRARRRRRCSTTSRTASRSAPT